MDGCGETPVSEAEFSARMHALGPFEPRPEIAVGCSGGGDSMALTLLLAQWAAPRDGRVTALIVDHRLRPESKCEAERAATWLSVRGIDARILSRRNEPVSGNLQSAARDARYALMSEACAEAAIPHLALAHNREDQAETVLLRLARGSGVDGLAAMAAVTERADLRLIRPLLNVPRGRLRATLRAMEQPWIEDPSNEATVYARVRFRRLAPDLAAEGLTPDRLVATASRLGRVRAVLDAETASVLARGLRLYPAGYGELDPGPLRAAPSEIALRCLSQVLTCVSGGRYPPRMKRLERLYRAMTDPSEAFAGRTLGGCRILRRRNNILICREIRAIHDCLPAQREVIWDGRFRIRLRRSRGFDVRRLGQEGWRMVSADDPTLRNCRIPAPVRPSLPAIWGLDAVAVVPHLNYVRAGRPAVDGLVRDIEFAPARPLTAACFVVHTD